MHGTRCHYRICQVLSYSPQAKAWSYSEPSAMNSQSAFHAWAVDRLMHSALSTAVQSPVVDSVLRFAPSVYLDKEGPAQHWY